MSIGADDPGRAQGWFARAGSDVKHMVPRADIDHFEHCLRDTAEPAVERVRPLVPTSSILIPLPALAIDELVGTAVWLLLIAHLVGLPR